MCYLLKFVTCYLPFFLFVWFFSNFLYIIILPFQEKFLKMIGDTHPQFDFLKLLSLKCSFNIFNSEHVRCILDHLSSSGLGKHLKASAELLLVRTIAFMRRGIILCMPSNNYKNAKSWKQFLNLYSCRLNYNSVIIKLNFFLKSAGEI